MKKIIVIAFVAVLALVCTVSAFAAGSLNANEKKIIAAVEQTIKVGDASYKVPAAYVNQAKNYFLSADVDVTEDEATAVISQINKGIDAIKAESAAAAAELDLSDFSRATKEKLLEYGQAACAVLNINLTYDSAENIVEIKEVDGTVVFSDEPIIKKTGSDVSVPAVAIVVVLLTVLSAGAVVVTKKSELF